MPHKTLEARTAYQRRHRATKDGAEAVKKWAKSDGHKKAMKKHRELLASDPKYYKAGGLDYERKVRRLKKYEKNAYCGKSRYTLEEKIIIQNWTGSQPELAIKLHRTLRAIEHKISKLKRRSFEA